MRIPFLTRLLGVTAAIIASASAGSQQPQLLVTNGDGSACTNNQTECGPGCIAATDTCCGTDGNYCSADTYCMDDGYCCPMGDDCGSLSSAGTVVSSFTYFNPSTAARPTTTTTGITSRRNGEGGTTTATSAHLSTSVLGSSSTVSSRAPTSTSVGKGVYHYKADGKIAAAGIALAAAVLL